MSALRTVLFAPLGITLCFVSILLLLGQSAALIQCFRQRGWSVRCLLSAANMAGNLVLLTLLLDGAYVMDYLPYQRSYPAMVLSLYDSPCLVSAALELLFALALALDAYDLLRYAQRHPTAQSIKQAVDLLPTGVCISDRSGLVLLANLNMNRWNQRLTGGRLYETQELLDAVKTHATQRGNKLLLRLDDGTALLFAQNELELDGARYLQLTAEDVTEQYRVTKELEEKTQRLRDLQRRLKTYHVRENELIIQQELLAARMTVHNQIGCALLTGKYHLEHPESTDAATIRLMLRQINDYLLSEAEQPEPEGDPYEAALEQAACIGVTVDIRGMPPSDRLFRSLAGQAVAECAANAVKHAGGDLLQVEFGNGCVSIVNNGAPPAGEITPSGGLRSLQLAAEQAGGRMELHSCPRFELRLSFPRDHTVP